MDDGDIDPLQKKRLFRRRLERSLLNEWYGPGYAARETAEWGVRARPVADFLAPVTRSVFSEETDLKMRLENAWPSVVGDDLAAMSRVGGLSGGVLTLEVRHSIYRKELANAAELITALVNRHFGKSVCREIRLEASNRRSRKFDVKNKTSK